MFGLHVLKYDIVRALPHKGIGIVQYLKLEFLFTSGQNQESLRFTLARLEWEARYSITEICEMELGQVFRDLNPFYGIDAHCNKGYNGHHPHADILHLQSVRMVFQGKITLLGLHNCVCLVVMDALPGWRLVSCQGQCHAYRIKKVSRAPQYA